MALPSMVESNWKSSAQTTRSIRADLRVRGRPGAFAPAVHAALQALLGPQPLHLLLVDPAVLVVAQRRPGPTKPHDRDGPWRKRAARPQIGVRIGRARRQRDALVGGAGEPDCFARQPF